MCYCNPSNPYPCSCYQRTCYQPVYPCPPSTTECGTTYTWDFGYIIYNKAGGAVNNLPNLDLPNGSSLKTIIETIDTYIGQLLVPDWSLPYLRDEDGLAYTINSVQQFAEAVDNVLDDIGFLGNVTADPSDAEDGQYWFRTDDDELKIKLNGVTRVISIT